MTLWVACYTCRESFDATLHPGLVRCAACTERSAWRIPSAAGRTVEVAA